VLYIVREVIGGLLAHESQADLITVVRHGRNARTENSVRGRRLVTITETSEFMHIDEGQLKRLTGEPVISVDEHYAKREIKTPVTFTIWVVTNDLPSLTNFDGAMRERIVVIPSGPTIPEEQRDNRLARKILAAERDGILTMLARACAEYHRSGLVMPLAVQMETDRYRGQQNTVANFLRDCAIMTAWRPGEAVPSVQMVEAWQEYQRWARGETRLTRNAFYEHMARQPGVTRVDNSGSVRRFEGLCWNDTVLRRLREKEPG